MKLFKSLNFLIVNFWPIPALLLLNFVLFFTNFVPGTFLTGWDNLHPEFSIGTNIQRSIFAVWQEYQGLGLLGGMGHASDLLRQIYVLALTLFFPIHLVRYISTFTMLFLGGIGAYYLIFLIMRKIKNSQPILNLQFVSFIGALFYTLNIGTIQTFYAPFEAFITHFAALPWLILSSILFLEKETSRYLIFLLIILFLSTPSAYIPTLYLVYLLAIGIYILVSILISQKKIVYFLNSVKLFALIILVNAFWLLPSLYFTLNNSSVNLNAKMNQMATQTIFLQNKEFGNLFDVSLLRGFWFNNVDPNFSGNFSYMMLPWRDQFSNPYVLAAAFILFGLIIIGAIYSLLNKKTLLPFLVIFIFSFTMLATNSFPFAFFDSIFRKIPLFSEAFRFPFTKFNSLAALSYGIMLAIGIYFILERILNRKSLLFIRSSLFFVPALLILYVSFPVFSGHLFYNKETINIPKEYFQTFDFFKKEDPTAKIANLPQPSFWGWTFYKWGFGGSGFLWYGIKQPILDRAFDVWSETSENYYFELSSALYSKDTKTLVNVLNKYDITFLLLDKNVIYPNSPKALFYDETEKLLSQVPGLVGAAQFGDIKIYKFSPQDKPNNFVYTKGKLPFIETSFWKTSDPAYTTFGNYIFLQPTTYNLQPDYSYPFGSFFSLKTQKEEDFEFTEQENSIVLQKEIETKNASVLKIPALDTGSNSLALSISSFPDNQGNPVISATGKTPQVFLDGEKTWGKEINIPLFSLPSGTKYPVNININGASSFNLTSADSKNNKILGTGFLIPKETNWIVATGQNTSKSVSIQNSIFEDLASSETSISIPSGKHTISITIPKINDSYLSFLPSLKSIAVKPCDYWRRGEASGRFSNGEILMEATNSSTCTSFYSSSLLHDLSYVIFIKNRNIQGRTLHFWVLNEDEAWAPLDTYLDKKNNLSYVLPPMETNGRAYSFHFDNISIVDKAQNAISGFAVYPIPFSFITGVNLSSENPFVPSVSEPLKITSVSHPQTSLYEVSLVGNTPTTLVLSQSYDKGWKAYEIKNKNLFTELVPFLFGKEVQNHVMVNGWANGWTLPDNLQPTTYNLIIIYLPQYLEYLGFLILLIIPISIALKPLIRRSR